jgi:hypothetical protein
VFIGHFGVALAAKKVAPRTSLGTLVMAAQFVDLLWPLFLLMGIERVIIDPGNTVVTPLDFISYPISHSLLADLGWACLVAGIYKVVKRDSRGALCLWFVLMSHWVLDAVSHRPDLPLYPGSSTYVGLGLWHSRTATIYVESAIFAFGAVVYARATRPRDRIGSLAYRSFLALLLLFYLLNIFGPPPPSEKAVAYAALGMWVFVVWGYWLDRHRFVVPLPPPAAPTPLNLFPEPPAQM